MTKTLTINKVEKEELGNYENDSQYLEYVELLRQYFEIKNDEEKLQNKFNEIIIHHQKLVQSGIIVIWWKGGEMKVWRYMESTEDMKSEIAH